MSKAKSHADSNDYARQVLKDIGEAIARCERAQEKWRHYGIDGAVRAWRWQKRRLREEESRRQEMM